MKGRTLFFIVFFALSGLIIGLVVAGKFNLPCAAISEEIKKEPTPVSSEGFNMEDAVINVANTAGKAVVSISTEQVAKVGGGQRKYYRYSPFSGQDDMPSGNDELFRRFFDDFFGDMPEREFRQTALGSGVIIDHNGYILTNEHVVDNADKITVTLSDGREFKAQVRGKDARSDLAVIKIAAPKDLPTAVLGDSDSLKIGQWVVAIGNPFGFAMQNPEPTVTTGVISALHRSLGRALPRDKDFNDLIQTDAAINPGNSGGPLVNLKGEIVGINVAIFSTTGGYQGVGFAIPSNNAKRIVSRLIEGKKISYGWLGVTVQDLTGDLAEYFNLSDKNGVLVAKVLKGSPAERAGIKVSDIIRQFDDKPIGNVKELLNNVGKAEVGKKIKVTLIREKKETILSVEVGERPQDLEKTEEEAGQSDTDTWRGIKAEETTGGAARRFRVEEKTGALVTEVEPNSPADNAGIIPGDVILEINRQQVQNLLDYTRITKAAKGNVLIRTDRGYFLVKEDSGK
ncbi:MAG: Do family serine endopeptidase [Candidatus Omnitrophota bacterium]|nr:Do family serine endopeptidase [Candidatus Omnitrophota bacterium]MBU1929760.1 Do family serine endopeptidase [Candidatus Omnitrophota bacterium]MBU2035412.1 Do family serine endopeptidase [Candidatus Omnitrophota bacterium]